jgi:hypothetical protein
MLAMPAAVRLQVAVYLPLELFPLMGDGATLARLRAELAADLARGLDELVHAQRLHFLRCALAADDAATARQELDAVPQPATMADAAQRRAWQVAESATLLAEGQWAAALAALPDDAPSLSAELQARGLAVRVAAERQLPAGLQPATAAQARQLLALAGLHAVAAHMLRRALAGAP